MTFAYVHFLGGLGQPYSIGNPEVWSGHEPLLELQGKVTAPSLLPHVSTSSGWADRVAFRAISGADGVP